MARMSFCSQNVVSSPSNPATLTLGKSAHASLSMDIRSSALKRRALAFALLTPIATITSSKSCDARETMSMCPLVTGSKEPGQTALRTCVLLSRRGGGAAVTARVMNGVRNAQNVPEHCLAVLLPPSQHEALGPRGFHATRSPLHHDSTAGHHPVVRDQQAEDPGDLLGGQRVGRVQEHHVVRRGRRCREHRG